MRHDPAVAAIVIMLRELKMFGMAQAVSELAEQGAPAFEAAQSMLSQLLKAETAEREVRAVAYQLKQAGTFADPTKLAGLIAVAQQIAAGDLSGRMEVSRRDEIGQLMLAMQQMGNGLSQMVSGLQAGIEQLASSAQSAGRTLPALVAPGLRHACRARYWRSSSRCNWASRPQGRRRYTCSRSNCAPARAVARKGMFS